MSFVNFMCAPGLLQEHAGRVTHSFASPKWRAHLKQIDISGTSIAVSCAPNALFRLDSGVLDLFAPNVELALDKHCEVFWG